MGKGQQSSCLFAGSDDLLNGADAFVFHSPFCKLVQKSVARLLLNDFLRNPDGHPELIEFRYECLVDHFSNNSPKFQDYPFPYVQLTFSLTNVNATIVIQLPLIC